MCFAVELIGDTTSGMVCTECNMRRCYCEEKKAKLLAMERAAMEQAFNEASTAEWKQTVAETRAARAAMAATNAAAEAKSAKAKADAIATALANGDEGAAWVAEHFTSWLCDDLSRARAAEYKLWVNSDW